jgi:hypothetical protein
VQKTNHQPSVICKQMADALSRVTRTGGDSPGQVGIAQDRGDSPGEVGDSPGRGDNPGRGDSPGQGG